MTTSPPGRGDKLVPTQLAALAAGVPDATIRKWASRGKITRHGTPGRAMYDLDELMDILDHPDPPAAARPDGHPAARPGGAAERSAPPCCGPRSAAIAARPPVRRSGQSPAAS